MRRTGTQMYGAGADAREGAQEDAGAGKMVTDRQSVMKAIWQEKRMVADRRSVNPPENRKKAQVSRK
ncbi:MAG: hypothetical protein C6P35_13265 [Cohnella sp.]|nr:MAG: hypothetical protein C6P35_13265 [Cohnella sp.]